MCIEPFQWYLLCACADASQGGARTYTGWQGTMRRVRVRDVTQVDPPLTRAGRDRNEDLDSEVVYSAVAVKDETTPAREVDSRAQ